MNAEELAEALIAVTLTHPDTGDEGAEGALDAYTFAEGGALTSNAGFTVTLDDGSEFQVTVIQSRWARPDA